MTDPISLTTMSIQQDMQRMNVIANNAANALTSGFKREYLIASSQFDTGVSAALSDAPFMALPTVRTMTDTKPGVPRQTGNPLDLAIQDGGYFEVLTDTGPAYTRQGSFKLDERGRLVSQSGLPVAGVNGDIFISSSTPTIDREGRIFEQDKQIGQIKLVSFNSAQALTNIGGGLAIPTGSAEKQELKRPRMLQGQLESSNVDSTQEMVRMMETFRHFETSHRLLQAYDDINDKALRNLGQF